eukprot:jgi/Psemu1/283735/fgenesh1_pg.33_\
MEAVTLEKPLDDLIAQDFNKLSFHVRNAINEEMHGVTSLAPEETPKMVASALQQLELEIAAIPYKPAFNSSQQWNGIASVGDGITIDYTKKIHSYNKKSLATGRLSSYVNTLDFRMRFLRAELFDARKAAVRLIKFLEIVMEMYNGDQELLRRPIGLADLKTKQEKDFLKLGNTQLLPFRDRSGRRVIAMVPDLSSKLPNARLRFKIILYLWLVASENEETQKKGVVMVIWPRFPGNSKNAADKYYVPPTEAPTYWLKFVDSVPLRICAFHLCRHNGGKFLNLAFDLVGSVLINFRTRMKIHTGDPTEISYKLLGYGIPVDLLPVTESGKIKTKNLFQWIRVRRALEDSRNTNENGISAPHYRIFFDTNIECPDLNDVIFRSGKNHMSHPGNVMFQGLIESQHTEHSNAHQDDKAAITCAL